MGYHLRSQRVEEALCGDVVQKSFSEKFRKINWKTSAQEFPFKRYRSAILLQRVSGSSDFLRILQIV